MSTPNTPLSAWHAPLRALLGDTDALYGDHEYDDCALDSAVRTVFAYAKNPAGTELHDDSDTAVNASNLSTGTNVAPLMTIGSASDAGFCEILLRAAFICINGEVGALGFNTRPLTFHEKGDRKRQLTVWLENEISDIEATGTFVYNPKTWDQYLLSRL
jgi:hypothetical protein